MSDVDNRVSDVCFTINNYTDDDIDNISLLPTNYYVFGIEVGETGTPHLQGYFELSRRMRFTAIKKILPRAHLEKRKGTNEQAITYCKKDGKFTEQGRQKKNTGQGKRTDIEHMYAMVKEGKSNYEIQEAHIGPMFRYAKAVETVRNNFLARPQAFCKPTVIVYWGRAGSGKTSRVLREHPDCYIIDPDEQLWWDGYNGEAVILFDDFYGGVKYHKLLRMLDGNRMRLPVKGGHTYKRWTTVYFTSNQEPKEWYKQGMTDALQRRLTLVEEILYEPGKTVDMYVKV